MKTITVTFEISEEALLKSLNHAGKDFGLELSADIDLDRLASSLSEDIQNTITQDLTNFLEEGLNSDLYSEFFNFVEDEDRDEE